MQPTISEEIKEAMEGTDRPVEPRVTNEDPEMWAEVAEWEEQRADILAAAVRELTGEYADAVYRLKNYVINVDAEFEVLYRYRAALKEGGGCDDCNATDVSETDFGNTKNQSSTETIKELKPCPLCGRQMQRTNLAREWIHPDVDDCVLWRVKIADEDVELWNRRTAERGEVEYRATREELVKALREAKVRLYHVPLASELVYRIDDILSREKS